MTDQELLTGAALTVFRLNGQFLALAEALARPAGLTATRWQVLGAVLTTPRSVAGIAREMGITRQSVQRTADQLVDDGLAEYADNPTHRRAKLLRPTSTGLAAIGRIGPGHADAARHLVERVGAPTMARTVAMLERLSAALDDIDQSVGATTTSVPPRIASPRRVIHSR